MSALPSIHKGRDRGVALLLSIVMLAIFLTTAVAFILFSGSIRQSSELQKANTASLILADHVLDDMRVLMENTMAPINAFDSIDDTYFSSATPLRPRIYLKNGTGVTVWTPQTNWGNPTVAGTLEETNGTDLMDIRYTGRPTNITAIATGVDMTASVREALRFNFGGDLQVQIQDPQVGWISTALDAPSRAEGTEGGYYYYAYAVIPLSNQYSPSLYGPAKSGGDTDLRVHGASTEEIPLTNFYNGASTPSGMALSDLRDTHWESLQHLQAGLDASSGNDDTALTVFFPDVAAEVHSDDAEKLPWDRSSAHNSHKYDGHGTDAIGSFTATQADVKVAAYNAMFAGGDAASVFDLKTASPCPNNRLAYNAGASTQIYGRLRYLHMPEKTSATDLDDTSYQHFARHGADNVGHGTAQKGYMVDPRVCSTSVYANMNDFIDSDSIPTTFRDLKADFTAMDAEAIDWTRQDALFFRYLSTVANDMQDYKQFTVGLEAVPYFRQLKSRVTRTSAIPTDVAGRHTFDVNFSLEWAQMYPVANPGRVSSFNAKVKLFYTFWYQAVPNVPPVAPAITSTIQPFSTTSGAWQQAYGMVEVDASALNANALGLGSTTFSATIPDAHTYVNPALADAYNNEIRLFQAVALVMFEDTSGNMIDWAVTPPIRRYNLGAYNVIGYPYSASPATIVCPDNDPAGVEANGFTMSGAAPYLEFSWEALDPRCNNYVFKPAWTERRDIGTNDNWNGTSVQHAHYPGAYDFVTSRFSTWDLACNESGAVRLGARTTLAAPSAIGNDPNTRPWLHLAQPRIAFWERGYQSLINANNAAWTAATYFGTDSPFLRAFNDTTVTAPDYNAFPTGIYGSYQGLSIDAEPYMKTGTFGYNGQSGANSWTAKVSTAYIKNSSFGSMKELGLIGRGESFRTLNLTRGMSPLASFSMLGNSTVNFNGAGNCAWYDVYRCGSGIARSCNDRTLLHYLKFGDEYSPAKYMPANFLSVFERNPKVIDAYMRECYSANPVFDDPDYGDDSQGRVPDARATTLSSYFPCLWGNGWDVWGRYSHTFNLRKHGYTSAEGKNFMVYPGCPGFGNIIEISQINNSRAGQPYLFDSQAEGIFNSNYRLIGPGHRYFLAVFNIRHTARRATADFDPEDYDSQMKMVVLFERITPPLDTAPVSSRIIAKQIIMD